MALRPIDNALPVTPERDRPKKQAKISISSKGPDFSCATMKNDENQAPAPPALNPDQGFDYILSEDLKPLSDPEARIQSLVEGLESKDWTKVCDSLNDVRRFALYNSDLLLPVMEKVILVLIKSMKNPRSTLCKTSIMASADLFTAYGDKLILDPNHSEGLDQLLLQLLLKASQDKRFVCEEADKTLKTLVQSTSPLPLLRKLQAYVSHGNPRVRAKAAVSLSKCVSNMNTEELREFGFASLLQKGADMLNDRLPEAREAARGTVMAMYEKFPENGQEDKKQSWEELCQSSLPSLHAQSIIKITLSQ